MLTIGESIQKAREERGYSRSELSYEARVPVQNIYQWESGRAFPNIMGLISIADALNISLDELVGRTVKADE